MTHFPDSEGSPLDYESRTDFKSRRRRWFLRRLFALTPARRVGLEFALWMFGLLVAGLGLAIFVSLLR